MQKLQLSIPEPCHENWQNMTPTDQGRFCKACAKEVVDFSTMTDMQVLNYFNTITNEKVCGRALPEQLDRTISRLEQPKRKLFWYWNYVAMFFMLFAKGNTAKAQGGIKPVTEMSPVKTDRISGGMEVNIGLNKELSRLINGNVKDKYGKEVPFASIKIKGTNSGVSADANGDFKIKAFTNAILVVSAVGYKVTEVSVGTQSVVSTVLEKIDISALEGAIVVTVGGIRLRDPDEEHIAKTISKRIAVFEVKEESTGLLLDKAKVTIIRNADSKVDTAFTDKKGVYKFKGITAYYNYSVKVEATGYEPNEFVIESNEFIDRKKVWEVLLRKQKLIENKKINEVVVSVTGTNTVCTKQDVVSKKDNVKVQGLNITSINAAASNADTRIRLGGVSSINTYNQPLLVIDGLPVTLVNISSVNPNDVENVEVLKGAKATVLYGSAAKDGAIIITTKKIKVKNLDTVSVSAYRTIQGSLRMGAMISGVSVKSIFTDTLKMVATNVTGAIKIYPNPVQRAEQFNLSLKLKQAGLFQIQITDAAGRIVLQQQFIALANEHNQKIMAANNWSAGIYYISIIDKNNKLISRKNFIVQ